MSSDLAERWQREVMGDMEARGWGTRALRDFAAGSARLYEIGLDAYLGLETLGVRRRETLPIPIVSVGNLTAGGTGKTPMTRFLCQSLTESGKRAAILSRGHGGQGTSVRLVSDASGNIARTAADAGDEPLLLARSLPGVPVLVGKDRRQSGREAMRRFGLDVLVLDDGFQFWQLARDLDIVLVDARRPFDNGHCLPRGLLREPPRHLSRAGIIVATRADDLDAQARDSLRARFASLAPTVPVFFASHRASGLVSLGAAMPQPRPLEELRGRRVVAWSAIARPDSFARTLAELGADIRHHIIRPDHFVPTSADVAEARVALQEESAAWIVMTEKDAVKWPEQAEDAFFLQIEMEIADAPALMAKIGERLFLAKRK
jgi:tetraacyldisaccharide 4'-kinase